MRSEEREGIDSGVKPIHPENHPRQPIKNAFIELSIVAPSSLKAVGRGQNWLSEFLDFIFPTAKMLSDFS